MVANTTSAGRKKKTSVVAVLALAASVAALILSTEMPSGMSMGAGASAALAELVARSPGARIGGVSLKGKSRRAALASPATGDTSGPGSAAGSVPGGAEGQAVPNAGTVAPGDYPRDFTAPYIPADDTLAAPASAPAFDFGDSGIPPVGGVAIIGGPGGVGGGSGGGGGGGGGGGIVVPPGPPATILPGVPEPSVWLMLIAGFGLIGGAMRRERRVRIA